MVDEIEIDALAIKKFDGFLQIGCKVNGVK